MYIENKLLIGDCVHALSRWGWCWRLEPGCWHCCVCNTGSYRLNVCVFMARLRLMQLNLAATLFLENVATNLAESIQAWSAANRQGKDDQAFVREQNSRTASCWTNSTSF